MALFLLLTLGLTAVGVAMLINPNILGPLEEAFDYAVPYILSAIGGLGSLVMVVALRPSIYHRAKVFERGFEFKGQLLSFEQIRGLQDVETYHSKYDLKARRLVIFPANSQSEIVAESLRMQNFNGFADVLSAEFTKYLVKGIKKTNINAINLSLSTDDTLLLSNGELVFEGGRERLELVNFDKMEANSRKKLS